MQKRQTVLNALMAALQFLVIGGTYFVLYRYLLRNLGADRLGLWSLVVAVTASMNIASLGMAGCVVKFVAQHAARGDSQSVAGIIETAFVSLALFLGALLLLFFPLLRIGLAYVVPAAALTEGRQILPLVLVAFWLFTLAQVFQAALDGHQRIDLRSRLLMGNELLYTILALFLVSRLGLLGLAEAYICRSLIAMVAGRWLLRRLAPSLPLVPHHWNKALFREMVGYGMNFQAISVVQMLVDPLTKILMSKFGTLSMTGYYEMAYRLVLQVRGLLVSANGVIVPVVADLQERAATGIQDLYQGSFKLVLFLSLPVFSLIILLMPAVSQVWIGSFNRDFVLFGIVIAIAYMVNTLSGPAYFTSLGQGRLRDNVVTHILMGILNAGLGYLGGRQFGGYGVAIGWALSMVISSAYLMRAFARREKLSFHPWRAREDRLLIAASLLALAAGGVAYVCFSGIGWPTLGQTAVAVCAFTVVILAPIWRHSMFTRLQEWLVTYRLPRPVR